MKLFKTKYPWVITAFVLAIFYDISCTKDDQLLDTFQTNTSTDHTSIKVSTPPTIDGTIDPAQDAGQEIVKLHYYNAK